MTLLLPLLVVGAILVVWEVRARLAADSGTLLADFPPWSRSAVLRLPNRTRAVATLARAEARRMLLHPVIVVGLVTGIVSVGLLRGQDGFDRYIELTGGGPLGFYLPPVVFFAANLCASRTRRSRAGELFDATPASPADRTLAQCLAVLVGPVLVTVAILVVAFVYYTVSGPALPATPPFAQFLALPLSVLGAGTLGVMTARWLPFRGASLVVFVLVVGASIALDGDHPMLMTLTEFPEWTSAERYVLVDVPEAGAHAAYLFGLSAMAAIGALLVHRERRRLLLGLGAVATAGTAWAAWLAA